MLCLFHNLCLFLKFGLGFTVHVGDQDGAQV